MVTNVATVLQPILNDLNEHDADICLLRIEMAALKDELENLTPKQKTTLKQLLKDELEARK